MKNQILLLWLANGISVDTQCERNFDFRIRHFKLFVISQITSFVHKRVWNKPLVNILHLIAEVNSLSHCLCLKLFVHAKIIVSTFLTKEIKTRHSLIPSLMWKFITPHLSEIWEKTITKFDLLYYAFRVIWINKHYVTMTQYCTCA